MSEENSTTTSLDLMWNPDWMSALPDKLKDVPLTCLAIPGTHNSLAIESDMNTDLDFSPYNPEMVLAIKGLPDYPMFVKWKNELKSMWKVWTSKQGFSISQQLELGVRFFDIRIAKVEEKIRGEHGLFTKEIHEYLKEIAIFLAKHPKEIVILYFKHFNNLSVQDASVIVGLLGKVFESKLCPCSRIDLITLRSFWQYNYQVLISFTDTDIQKIRPFANVSFLWPGSIFKQNHIYETHVDGLICSLNVHYANLPRDVTSFNVTETFLSPSMNEVFQANEGHASAREMCSQKTNSKISSWLKHKTGLNIVLVDYAEYDNVIERIIKVNENSL